MNIHKLVLGFVCLGCLTIAGLSYSQESTTTVGRKVQSEKPASMDQRVAELEKRVQALTREVDALRKEVHPTAGRPVRPKPLAD